MAIQKITGDVIATSAVTADSLADTTITAAKLHTTLDLTGKTVTVSTASAGDNDTTVASTAFVATAVANLADSAPDALNTLNELAAALGDDANFSTTVTNSIALKAPLASPTFTGTINSGPINSGNIAIQASGTDGTSLEVGKNSSSNHFAYVDLVGDSTYTDYGLRLIRGNSGANTNSGLYHRGTGSLLIETQEAAIIGLRTAGSAALTLDASQNAIFAGNVGIGTASPDLKLHIDGVNAYPATSGTTPNGMLHLRAKTAGGTHGLYMGVANASPYGSWLQAADSGNLAVEYPLLLNPNGGNVGIGISNPQQKLTVGDGADSEIISIFAGSGGASGIHFTDTNTSGDDFQGFVTYDHSADALRFGTAETERLRINSRGALVFTPSSGVEVNNSIVAHTNNYMYMFGNTSGLILQNNVSGDTRIRLEDANAMRFETSSIERMRIDSSGNINVGTTAKSNSYPARFITTSLATPSSGGEACHILELVGRRNQNAGNQNGMIQFWNTTSTATETARISGIQGTGLNSGALTFATYAAGTYGEALRIDQNGNVGIGTTAVTSPGLWYDATNDYLAISHWATPPTPAALLHLSDNSNNLDVPQIRIEGRENAGDTKLDISVKDAGVRLNLIEGPAGDASNGYGLMEFKTNAAVNASNPTRGGFKFTTPAYADNLVITNTGNVGVGGNLGVGTISPNNMSHTQNTAITATQSTGNSWSTPSSAGTYSVQGAIEAAGIRNRHVAKWALSGNLSANNWYPFTKRSELVALCSTTGSNSEQGFGMYFRIYTYLSSSGYGEYFSNRVSSTIWVTNNGSNSVQGHELYIGPGWGHAPNGGHDSDSATSCPFRMRVMHHNGSDSTWPAEQTVEIRCAAALSGLNSTVSGRQLMIYGYII